MGFIWTVGINPHASDCTACARPISPPSKVTQALFDIFCALKGATRTPWPCSHAQNAVVTQLLPAPEPQPRIDRAFIATRLSLRGLHDGESLHHRISAIISQTCEGKWDVCSLPIPRTAVSILAPRQAWEGGSQASLHALLSPETGLAIIFSNIAAGDLCIALGNGT